MVAATTAAAGTGVAVVSAGDTGGGAEFGGARGVVQVALSVGKNVGCSAT